MKIYFKLCPKEEMDLEDRQTQEVGCRRVLNYIYSLVILYNVCTLRLRGLGLYSDCWVGQISFHRLYIAPRALVGVSHVLKTSVS